MSNAADRDSDQFGINMSAGRDLSLAVFSISMWSVCLTRFWGSNPGEVNFSPFILFLAGSAILSKDVVCVVVLTFIRGMFFLACMAVNNIQAAVTQ